MAEKPYVLYGMMASLYTAKVRAYLRYHRIDFVERVAGLPEFTEKIVPVTNRWIVPVVVTPEGATLQDGSVILDYLDQKEPNEGSIHPRTPVLQTVAHLFELFGGEGLLRPAMHYRWNFDQENLEFIKVSFADVLAPNLPKEEHEGMFLHASGRMRQATRNFGVTEETKQEVEASYHEFLALIDAHLSQYPFLFGGRPTIADYALFGPLFAHLGRDPKPLAIMQNIAPHLFQWVERMNAPAGYGNHLYNQLGGALIPDDNIPDTLLALMRYISEEYLPEITSHVAFANDWIANHEGIEPGTNGLERPTSRTLGTAEFNWRGMTNRTVVMPYRFFLLQRLTDHYEALDQTNKTAVSDLFSSTGLGSILTLKTDRRVIRKDHLEVWE